MLYERILPPASTGSSFPALTHRIFIGECGQLNSGYAQVFCRSGLDKQLYFTAIMFIISYLQHYGWRSLMVTSGSMLQILAYHYRDCQEPTHLGADEAVTGIAGLVTSSAITM